MDLIVYKVPWFNNETNPTQSQGFLKDAASTIYRPWSKGPEKRLRDQKSHWWSVHMCHGGIRVLLLLLCAVEISFQETAAPRHLHDVNATSGNNEWRNPIMWITSALMLICSTNMTQVRHYWEISQSKQTTNIRSFFVSPHVSYQLDGLNTQLLLRSPNYPICQPLPFTNMAESDEALMTSSLLNPPSNDMLAKPKVAIATNDRRRSTSDVFQLRRSSTILESVPRCSVCRRRFHSLGNLANHHQLYHH